MGLTDTDTTAVEEPSADGLDHLLLQAQNIDAGQSPQAAAVPVEVVPSNTADELLGVLTMARLMVAPMFAWWQEFGGVWNDATIKAIADGGGAVMDRHGWSVGEVLGQWGPYIALIGAVAPPSFVTYQAIKAREKEGASVSAEQAKD